MATALLLEHGVNSSVRSTGSCPAAEVRLSARYGVSYWAHENVDCAEDTTGPKAQD